MQNKSRKTPIFVQGKITVTHKTALTRTACATFVALTGFSGALQAQELLGYISPIASQPNEQLTIRGVTEAATANGWDIRPLDSNLSSDRQVGHIDTLITMGSKVIAVWSLDPNAVAGALTRANEAGIPVIGINSEGDGVTDTVYWGINTCEPGGPYEVEAAWIAERRPGAKVVVMGGPPAPSIRAMVECFTNAAKAAGLEVIDQVDNTKDSSANAATLAADELIRFPQTQVFWAFNDATALGISAAITASGGQTYTADTPDGIMVFGVNGDAEAIEAVRDGRLTGTWDPDTYAVGVVIAKRAMELAENPDAAPMKYTVPSTLITAENLGSYVPPAERSYTQDNVPLVK